MSLTTSTYNEVISLINKIDKELGVLRELSLSTDLNIVVCRESFFNLTIAIYEKYQRIDLLLSGTSFSPKPVQEIKLTIARRINPNQMEGYLAKVQKNTLALMNNVTIEKVKEQYVPIEVVIKVLNGDAYFTGCTHGN
jgi:hypothetical protein